jgi:hypothetical protein
MRKLILSIIAASTIPALALAQAPDAKAKAEQILKQARAAIGGEKKLKELQSLSLTGTIRRGAGDNQRESDLEIDILMPDKVKKTTSDQFMTMVNALNGDQTWNDFIPGVGGGGFGGRRGGGPGATPDFQRGAGSNSSFVAYMQLQQRREMYQILLGWLLATPAGSQVEFAFVGEAPGPEGSKVNVLDGKNDNGFTTRLYFDQQSNQLVGLSFKAKQLMRGFGRRGPGGPGGGGRPQGRPQSQGEQAGQPGQAGQRPELTPEERERRRQERDERFEKAPELDYRWAFGDYKNEGGLNLPHRMTKLESGAPIEEWEITKIKVNPKLTPDPALPYSPLPIPYAPLPIPHSPLPSSSPSNNFVSARHKISLSLLLNLLAHFSRSKIEFSLP